MIVLLFFEDKGQEKNRKSYEPLESNNDLPVE